MYSVSRKNCEKTEPLVIRAARFDPVSVRSRKMRSGNNGALERDSITKNETISTTEAAADRWSRVCPTRAAWRASSRTPAASARP